MLKNPITNGLLLFFITMALFFATRFLFPVSDFFNNSLAVNSFVLPIIYCGMAFLSVRYAWKRRKLSFKEAFSRAFIPMFVGGLLSVISIFSHLNFIDRPSKDILNVQFVERNRNELTKVYEKEKSRLKTEQQKIDLEKDYQKSLQSFSKEQVSGKDLLTFRYFSIYFAAILIFYLVLSLFFAFFFRTKGQGN